jgi:hypothetical protein
MSAAEGTCSLSSFRVSLLDKANLPDELTVNAGGDRAIFGLTFSTSTRLLSKRDLLMLMISSVEY